MVTWEAVTALASLVSAVIVAVAALAAVIQIRHLRTGNQLEAILGIYATFNAPHMVEARRFCTNELPAQLRGPDGEPLVPDTSALDARVLLVANFHNEVGSLVADGFLDERLVWPLVAAMKRVWEAVEPIAIAYRRQRSDPIWADFEYLAAIRDRITPEMYLSRYPAWFRTRLRAELEALRTDP